MAAARRMMHCRGAITGKKVGFVYDTGAPRSDVSASHRMRQSATALELATARPRETRVGGAC